MGVAVLGIYPPWTGHMLSPTPHPWRSQAQPHPHPWRSHMLSPTPTPGGHTCTAPPPPPLEVTCTARLLPVDRKHIHLLHSHFGHDGWKKGLFTTFMKLFTACHQRTSCEYRIATVYDINCILLASSKALVIKDTVCTFSITGCTLQ